MNADARHGGSRPKRCLPAKLHPKIAHYGLNSKITTTRLRLPIRASSFPESRQTIVTASKRANSHFFTNSYPISAVFAPKVNQIGTRLGINSAPLSHHEMHNY